MRRAKAGKDRPSGANVYESAGDFANDRYMEQRRRDEALERRKREEKLAARTPEEIERDDAFMTEIRARLHKTPRSIRGPEN